MKSLRYIEHGTEEKIWMSKQERRGLRKYESANLGLWMIKEGNWEKNKNEELRTEEKGKLNKDINWR
jgi:hypothetical protein